jgi:hypothetical protein
VIAVALEHLHCTPDEALARMPETAQWVELMAYFRIKQEEWDKAHPKR